MIGERKKYLTELMEFILEKEERNYTQPEIAKMRGCSIHNIKRAKQRAKGRTKRSAA